MQLIVAVALVMGTALLVWKDVLPLVARLVVVHEARHTSPSSVAAEPMPDDLYGLAQSLAGEWARDDTIAAMREAYAETGDWSLVRSKFQGAV